MKQKKKLKINFFRYLNFFFRPETFFIYLYNGLRIDFTPKMAFILSPTAPAKSEQDLQLSFASSNDCIVFKISKYNPGIYRVKLSLFKN